MCGRGNRCSRPFESRNKCPMSPYSREHAPSSRTVLLLQEHQRPATPCSVTPGCRPDATTARRFLRWFGRLGRPIMGKQGVLEMTATENTIRFSGHTLDKATKAKVTLENYYSNLIAQHIERKQRLAKLEESLKD